MNRRILRLLSLILCLAVLVGASTAALAKEFYNGKTIRFVVGFSPGGGYDTYTRAVARHFGKHIPGNPTPIVQNMTGAGSLVAANYISNRAKPDGLTVGVWNSAMVFRQALRDRGVKFDARKLNWIGTPSVGLPSCGIMGFTGLKSWKDLINSKRSLKMGSTRAGSTTYDLPKILNKTFGTNFNVISGYGGTATIRIAMQKGEVDGACWGWESMRVTARPMLDAKGDEKFIPILTHGNPQDPEVKGLPQLTEIVKGENLAIVKAWLNQYNFQRPLSLPPGTPKDRVGILRKALAATLKDPVFLAEAKKSKLIITYVS
ncbi:MAG: hypothetical protein QF619_14170, partial [Candidatus Binatia bacterium]|nr:hypothetical protein [Candidatus Binatia bacterium]